MAIARAKSQCWQLRRVLGILCLCAVFGIQGLFSVVFWGLCMEQLELGKPLVTSKGHASVHDAPSHSVVIGSIREGNHSRNVSILISDAKAATAVIASLFG